VNVLENDSPSRRSSEIQSPLSLATVCATLSLLVHVTVAPTVTVIVAGLKEKFLMVIAVAEEVLDSTDVELFPSPPPLPQAVLPRVPGLLL